MKISWPAPLPPPGRVIGPALGILVDLLQRILLLLERLQGGEAYSRMGQGYFDLSTTTRDTMQ